jgi:Tat protein translocase TatB subunit
MDFFNIGGGELIVIILLALVLFRPEDIYKAMRSLGRYTRSARRMWNEFSTNIKQEMETREMEDALAETKTIISSAQDAVSTLKTSVSDVKRTVEGDVSAAGKALKTQANEGTAALKAQPTPVGSAMSVAAAAPGDAANATDEGVSYNTGDEGSPPVSSVDPIGRASTTQGSSAGDPGSAGFGADVTLGDEPAAMLDVSPPLESLGESSDEVPAR